MAKIKELEMKVDVTQIFIWFGLYIFYFLLLKVLGTLELGEIVVFL